MFFFCCCFFYIILNNKNEDNNICTYYIKIQIVSQANSCFKMTSERKVCKVQFLFYSELKFNFIIECYQVFCIDISMVFLICFILLSFNFYQRIIHNRLKWLPLTHILRTFCKLQQYFKTLKLTNLNTHLFLFLLFYNSAMRRHETLSTCFVHSDTLLFTLVT